MEVYKKKISFSLDAKIADFLDKIAKSEGITKTELLQMICNWFCIEKAIPEEENIRYGILKEVKEKYPNTPKEITEQIVKELEYLEAIRTSILNNKDDLRENP